MALVGGVYGIKRTGGLRQGARIALDGAKEAGRGLAARGLWSDGLQPAGIGTGRRAWACSGQGRTASSCLRPRSSLDHLHDADLIDCLGGLHHREPAGDQGREPDRRMGSNRATQALIGVGRKGSGGPSTLRGADGDPRTCLIRLLTLKVRDDATVWLRTLMGAGGTPVGARHSLLTSKQSWHTNGGTRMHNHIKSDRPSWLSQSKQPSFGFNAANTNQRLKLTYDEHRADAAKIRADVSGKVIPPSTDFEGFGSFS